MSVCKDASACLEHVELCHETCCRAFLAANDPEVYRVSFFYRYKDIIKEAAKTVPFPDALSWEIIYELVQTSATASIDLAISLGLFSAGTVIGAAIVVGATKIIDHFSGFIKNANETIQKFFVFNAVVGGHREIIWMLRDLGLDVVSETARILDSVVIDMPEKLETVIEVIKDAEIEPDIDRLLNSVVQRKPKKFREVIDTVRDAGIEITEYHLKLVTTSAALHGRVSVLRTVLEVFGTTFDENISRTAISLGKIKTIRFLAENGQMCTDPYGFVNWASKDLKYLTETLTALIESKVTVFPGTIELAVLHREHYAELLNLLWMKGAASSSAFKKAGDAMLAKKTLIGRGYLMTREGCRNAKPNIFKYAYAPFLFDYVTTWPPPETTSSAAGPDDSEFLDAADIPKKWEQAKKSKKSKRKKR